jgi:hypothetical protein
MQNNVRNIRNVVCCLLHGVLLTDVLFDPENRSDILLQNIGGLSEDYTALCPKRQNSS